MWCSGHVLFGRPKKSCVDVARQREVWLSLLRLPSYNTDSQAAENGWIGEWKKLTERKREKHKEILAHITKKNGDRT